MTTTRTKKSIYGDENPHDRDMDKAATVFSQSGVYDTKKIAEHVIMGRRHSVRQHRELEDMKQEKQKQDFEEQQMKTAIIGNKEYGQPGIVERVEEQGNQQRIMARNQNILLGIGMVLVVVVPIIWDSIGT